MGNRGLLWVSFDFEEVVETILCIIKVIFKFQKIVLA